MDNNNILFYIGEKFILFLYVNYRRYFELRGKRERGGEREIEKR